MKIAYLDNSATTPVLPEVLEAMKPYYAEKYGNPSSTHFLGMEAQKALDDCKEIIAGTIGAEREEVVFTSGGTEANNIAILGAAGGLKSKGTHIITTAIEHKSVLEPFRMLEKRGFKVTYLPVNREGFISMGNLEKAITKETVFASIQPANHEIGTIQEMEKIAKACSSKGVVLHVDACQGYTKMPIDVSKAGIDLLTLNGHKIHGPKGIGALYVRAGAKLENVYTGGEQGNSLRPGTENVPGAVGFAKAAELAFKDSGRGIIQMKNLRDRLMKGLLKIRDSRFNGPVGNRRLCSNVNITFRGVEAEAVLMMLSSKGICASSGSACTARSVEPSNVLTSIGLSKNDAFSTLRFSLSRLNTKEEIDYATEQTARIVEELRKLNAR
ncbi:MAG: cysteine desulfurase [Candidatus Aenigmarchaeota archaeon]|nr:cysteine desulfurase [Candidatus Aenigmarchaeota archaeon]